MEKTKICSMCNNEIPLSGFATMKKKYKHAECKSCGNKRRAEGKVELKKKMIQYKGGKCVRCGYNKHYGSLDFHHRDETEKEFSLGNAQGFSSSLEELDKCDLLCSNCHREVHHELKYGIKLAEETNTIPRERGKYIPLLPSKTKGKTEAQ